MLEASLGSGERPCCIRTEKHKLARKSIVANCKIKKGDVFTEDNITVKRPGDGISPMKWFEVIGQVAIRDFEEDELIEL